MTASRRDFCKRIVAYGGLFAISGELTITEQAVAQSKKTVSNTPLSIQTTGFKPLDTITVEQVHQGLISVRDGKGKEYWRQAITSPCSFQIGDALGKHTIILFNQNHQVLDFVNFEVDCQTEIQDNQAKFSELCTILHRSMLGFDGTNTYAAVTYLRERNQFYHHFVPWLRDHVHTLKGLKYFYPELKSGIDLYADYQRSDGMIWDNIAPRSREKNIWDLRFEYGDFILPIENHTYEFKRIPVENDVEFLFIEGLYYTWKATGDSEWMASRLKQALKALEYATSDPYRWSTKYQLLKRGFTIDTWDFVSDEDVVGYIGRAKDSMIVDINKTQFGIMFGDNTGMAMSCRYLAEMLAYVNRTDEAERVAQLGKQLMQRLNQIAWNGKFYTHHVPEDPTVQRHLGVDLDQQISLSNAYSINRDLTHEQCVAIIQSYQRIRQQMPATSPGEWYSIYPPFQSGFSVPTWEYVNAGVTTIVAGELAHGAFEHGFEAYGFDILERLHALAQKHDYFLHCTYRGSMPTPPQRQFTPLDLRAFANVDFYGTGGKNAIGWTGEGDNDLHQMPVGHQVFEDIVFDVIDPATNDRRACIGLSAAKGYLARVSIPVNQTASALYFLHAMSSGTIAGTATIRYQDGSTYLEEIGEGKIGNWWVPQTPDRGLGMPMTKVAWQGANQVCPNVGVYVYGMNNPHPEKAIAALELEGMRTSTKWLLLGITLSDASVFFMPDELSRYIPDNWGAAAVFYALMEGLAGIKDAGVAFDEARLAPRWQAARTNAVTVTARYAASDGYVSYQYHVHPEQNQLIFTFTGSMQATQLEILLPKAQQPSKTTLNGKTIIPRLKTVETSTYACLSIQGVGVHHITINFAT